MNCAAIVFISVGLLAGISASATTAPVTDDHHDEIQYLQGLIELNLPEVLEAYVEHHSSLDDVLASEFAIALDGLKLRATELNATERESLVQRILKQRDELLKTHRDDPRGAKWLADQASDIYFELLTIDACGLMTHLALPSEQQRERASKAAEMMLEYATRAERAVERALLDLEATPGFADDIALQLQRRRLAEEQRDRQIPFLHGIALYLHASFNIDNAREQIQMLEQATRMLLPLGSELHAPLNYHAKLYAAFAQARLGRREAAEATLQELKYVQTGDVALKFSAEVGAAMFSTDPNRELGRLAERYRSSDELFFRLLVADALFKVNRRRSLDDAFAAYTSILDEDHGLSDTQLRELVYARLIRAVEPSMATQSLPKIAVIAQASSLSKVETTRAQAIDMLADLLQSSELDDSDRALALYTLAQAHHASGQVAVAADLYIRIAREHPRASEAERAVELGVALAAEAHRASPAEGLNLLRGALQVLLSEYSNLPSVNRWRYFAGQLELSESNYDQALEHFQSVQRQSSHGPDAAFMQAQTLQRAAVAASTQLRARELAAAALQAVTATRPVLHQAMQSSQDVDQSDHFCARLAMLRVIEAQSMLALGEAHAALAAVEELDGDEELPGTIIAQTLQVRIEAYRSLGQTSDAQREVDRFIAAAPDRVAEVLVPWVTTLKQEVLSRLDQHNEQGAHELARAELAPLAQRLSNWLGTDAGKPHAARQLPRVADAYRLSGRFADALALYEQLMVDQPSAAALLFGRAECLFHLAEQADAEQRLGEAMLLYRRLSTAGPSVGERIYWQSHLRSLQILDRIDRNTQQIVPQIQRLRQVDSSLGGERLRRGFEVLHSKYALMSTPADS